ncbi:glycosyltransferase family 4 protein [Herbiconiux sp. P18]|uniref:glycosyltransferase family 4 protein n=1 Tax=Herbiconiux liangxiaofengii TaxID=3342795 RepID=UPI0035BB7C2C
MTRTPAKPDVIAFIQPFVPSYRKGLFDAIEKRLAREGLKMEVWHAEPKGIVASRRNSVIGPWSVLTKQHRISVRRRNVTFRAIHRRAKNVRAVITGLASSNIETYGLALDNGVNLMLWGHGRNFTAGNNPLDGRLEAWLSSRASHIFTYTQPGADHLIEAGLPADKVSVVVNTTDTDRLRDAQASAGATETDAWRERLEIGPSARAVLFVGAFDVPKRLPFLFEAADIVKRSVPEFVLILAGAGPLDDYVAEEARKRDFVRVPGRLEIDELGQVSNLIDLIAIPGRVGLVAVDSLALGTPIVTTRYPFHAPEADYLTEDNSVWSGDSVDEYAVAIIETLNDQTRLNSISDRARQDGEAFSAAISADNFVRGILRGLGSTAASTDTAGERSNEARLLE